MLSYKPKLPIQELSEETFKREYLSEDILYAKSYNMCGECIFFEPGRGCTTSKLEAKYGNSRTPACEEFKIKGMSNDNERAYRDIR
jgi:hypothetical protein